MLETENPLEIYVLLRTLGIRCQYTGCHYLAKSIHLAMRNGDLLMDAAGRLYPVVAEFYRTTPASVESGVRAMIGDCWENGDRSILEEIAGRRLTKKPHPAEFIDMLANHLLYRSCTL